MKKTFLNGLKVTFWAAAVAFALAYGDFSCSSTYDRDGDPDRLRYNPTTRLDY